jgi:hypothetical protein
VSTSIGTAMMTITMLMNMPSVWFPEDISISIDIKRSDIPIPIFLICIIGMIIPKGMEVSQIRKSKENDLITSIMGK